MPVTHGFWVALPILALVASPGVAQGSVPPDEIATVFVDGSAAVGQTLHVRIEKALNTAVDYVASPTFPDWVEGDRSDWHVVGEAGETLNRTWNLTATREGFWA